MAFQLQYRGTFIDVDSEPQHSKKRSASLPARPLQDPDSKDENIHHQSYLNSLSECAEHLRQRQLQKALLAKQFQAAKKDDETASLRTNGGSSLPTTVPSDAGSSVPSLGSLPDLEKDYQPGAELSFGSIGHPEVCRRPCIYFAAGTCNNGQNCGYCHCEHSGTRENYRDLDKRQREMLQKLSELQLLQLLVKPMRKRAENKGLQIAAAELLHITEQRLAFLQGRQGPATAESCAVPHKMISKLSHFFDGMPLSGLVGILMKKVAAGPTAEGISQALSKLRESLAMEHLFQGFFKA